jgi:ubiquinone/menaquinone biosynthesis C-methylase UbiE
MDAVDGDTSIPNHHAKFPPFSGISGLIAAASMLVGRSGDAEIAIELSGAGSGDTVVDIGCGPGAAARLAAKRGIAVVGVDPAPVMLAVARLLTRGPATVRYQSASAEALDLPDGSATVVWSLATVHHWSDVDRGLEEVRRVLEPGGRFVAIERLSPVGARGHASHGWTERQAGSFAAACSVHALSAVRIDRQRRGKRVTIAVTATRS